ncbi:hypothetical protein HK101_001267 [Irineochytrium annulatum]|nr:hypothetical protein HK101_001267 [Irineochytrium annulatum]
MGVCIDLKSPLEDDELSGYGLPFATWEAPGVNVVGGRGVSATAEVRAGEDEDADPEIVTELVIAVNIEAVEEVEVEVEVGATGTAVGRTGLLEGDWPGSWLGGGFGMTGVTGLGMATVTGGGTTVKGVGGGGGGTRMMVLPDS